jgi:hypothetical protein
MAESAILDDRKDLMEQEARGTLPEVGDEDITLRREGLRRPGHPGDDRAAEPGDRTEHDEMRAPPGWPWDATLSAAGGPGRGTSGTAS